MQNAYYHDQIPTAQIELLEPLWMSGVLCGGCGGNQKIDGQDGAFSGRVILGDALKRAYDTGLKYWAPSRNKAKAERHAGAIHAKRNGITVTNDFADLSRQSVETYGRDNTLLAVATDTGSGVDALEAAFAHNARFAWIDKPGITSIEQYRRMCGILAANPDRKMWMLHNHRNCSANHELRVRVSNAKAAGKRVKGQFGFRQPWFVHDHESQQAKSRLKDENGSLLDLKWHASDLMRWMFGEAPITLQGAVEEYYFAGKVDEYKDVVTGGASTYIFNNSKLSASVECNQADPNALWDDIFAIIEIEDKKALMWRMGMGGGDILFEATVKVPDKNNFTHWRPIEMGPGKFDDSVIARFCRSPLGHMPSAWSEMIFQSLLEVVGSTAREKKLEIASAGLLPPHMQTAAPNFLTVALHGIRDVIAHRESAASDGAPVDLTKIN